VQSYAGLRGPTSSREAQTTETRLGSRGASVEATGLSGLAAHPPIPSDPSCAPIFPRTDREPALWQKSWAGWRGKRQGEVICAATVRMGAACFLYVVVGEWEWDGIGPATPWKYPESCLRVRKWLVFPQTPASTSRCWTFVTTPSESMAGTSAEQPFPITPWALGVNQVPYFFYVRCVVAWLLPSC